MGKSNEGMLKRLSKLFSSDLIDGKSFNSTTASYNINSGFVVYDNTNDPTKLLNQYRHNANVYSVVNLIAKAASVVQWKVYRETDGMKGSNLPRMVKSTRYNEKLNNYGIYTINKNKTFEVVEDNNSLVRLLNNPNPLQAQSEFMEQLIGYKLITGNAISHGIRLNDGTINELWILPPPLVRIEGERSVEAVPERYILTNLDKSKNIISPDDILHLRYWSPSSNFWGLSPLSAGNKILSRNNQSFVASENAFRNNGMQGILFPKPDANGKLPFKSQEQFDEWAASFERSGKGAENNKNMIFASREIGWQDVGVSPVDLQILESQKLDLRQIAQLYNISSELLNDPDNKTQANRMEAKKSLYTEAILPMIDNVRDELNKFLTEPYNRVNNDKLYIDYELGSITALASDLDKQTDRLLKSYWITTNEKRLLQNFPVDNENEMMDELLVPRNLTRLSKLDEVQGNIGNGNGNDNENNGN